MRLRLCASASICILPRASACVCVHASVHRKLNVRTCLDAKKFCIQMSLLFKDFRDVLYQDVMTCYDKSSPSPDGRHSRLWCKNQSQLVALRIIHENTYVHTLVHFVFFFMQKRRPTLQGRPWGHNSLLDSTRYGSNTGNVVP